MNEDSLKSMTLGECFSEWSKLTKQNIDELRDITGVLQENEETLYKNYGTVGSLDH